MIRMVGNFIKRVGAGPKGGFGIVEVLVAAAILGFMCMALNRLQSGNHEAFLRIRGRDGATEVAQRVLDSLKSVGSASIPSCSRPEMDTVFDIGTVVRQWERGLGGHSSVVYSPRVTVFATKDYNSPNVSAYATIPHTYAKQVDVSVSWVFKGATQSVNVSGVVR